MRTPTVHLNGTSRDSLFAMYENAAGAVFQAREALSEAGPNARDYYVQGQDAFKEAADEHLSRDNKLKAVYEELMAILESLAT